MFIQHISQLGVYHVLYVLKSCINQKPFHSDAFIIASGVRKVVQAVPS